MHRHYEEAGRGVTSRAIGKAHWFGLRFERARRPLLWALLCAISVSQALVTSTAAVTLQEPQGESGPVHVLNVKDPYGISRAMSSGYSQALKSLAAKSLTEPLESFALASYYRTVFEIPRSSAYAKQCMDRSLRSLPTYAVTAIRCSAILAGNYLIDGQVAGWARTMKEANARITPVIARALRSAAARMTPETGGTLYPDNLILPGLWANGAVIDPSDYTNFPVEAIDIMGSNVVIRRVSLMGTGLSKSYFKVGICNPGIKCEGGVYYVNVRIDGRNVVAILDTGSSDVTVSSETAVRLGIKAVSGHYFSLVSWKDSHVPGRLGFARTIKIDGARRPGVILRNVPVVIAEGGSMPNAPVLGLNVLRELGAVLIGERQVIVDPVGARATCKQPLHVASNMTGSYSVVLKHYVGGSLQSVMVDTGMNQYLIGTSRSTAQSASSGTGNTRMLRVTGSEEVPYSFAYTTFGTGSSERYLKIPVFPGDRQSFPYVIGTGILQDFDIFLNFDAPAACLLPKQAGQAR